MPYNYTSLPIFNVFPTVSFFEDPKKPYSPRKKGLIKFQVRQMIKRTLQMFEWKNLPPRIPQRDMELMIQANGYIGIIKDGEEFYSVWGGLGGKPNWNYMPMTLVVANPYLNLSKIYNIYDTPESKKDVVIIPNDSLYEGLIPLISYHAEILTEIQLTKRATIIVHRMPAVPVAPDQNVKRDFEDFYDDLAEGELASIMSRNFIKDVATMPLSDSGRNIITQVLEMEQYQKASMYNDLGLQLNYNMKRESITSSEAQLGEGALLPLCDDMLLQRKKACEELKELWGLDISVEFSSAWINLRRSIEAEADKEEAEADKAEAEAENAEVSDGEIVQSIEQKFDEEGGENVTEETEDSSSSVSEPDN